jgi:acetoacetate decarboxylase
MAKKQDLPVAGDFPFPAYRKTAGSMMKSQLDMLRLKVKLWEDARFVLVDLPLNPVAANRILPGCMWLRRPYRATLFIADYVKTAFTVPYREAALLLHVRTPFGAGVHCPWMIVDDDTAMIYGRELLGYPKKMGDFHFSEKNNIVTAGLSRRGVEVVTVKARKKAPEPRPAPVLGMKTFNMGGMGQYMAFNPIWLFRPHELIHESYAAEAEVDIRHSDFDPVRGLVAEFRGPLPARVARIDILGSRVLLPVGLAGPGKYAASYELRYR